MLCYGSMTISVYSVLFSDNKLVIWVIVSAQRKIIIDVCTLQQREQCAVEQCAVDRYQDDVRCYSEHQSSVVFQVFNPPSARGFHRLAETF